MPITDEPQPTLVNRSRSPQRVVPTGCARLWQVQIIALLTYGLFNLTPFVRGEDKSGPSSLDAKPSSTKVVDPTEEIIPADAVAAVAYAATIEQTLNDLDADEFSVREAASRRLIEHGALALGTLGELANHPSPEIAARVFEVLVQIRERGDDDTYELIESLLHTLMAGDSQAVAARAEVIFNLASAEGHRRAIEAFGRLGGIVRYHDERDPRFVPAEEGKRSIKYLMVGRQWTGGDDGLKFLRRIEGFRRTEEPGVLYGALYVIHGAKISPERRAELRVEYARQYQERGPACLGVMSNGGFGGGNGCEVGGVEPGSAADNAGLKNFDTIVEFGDTPIQSFQDLIDQLREREPGNKIPIKYIRDDRLLTTTVELKEWK